MSLAAVDTAGALSFGPEHLPVLDEALYVAEHCCADYFRYAGKGWKELRFELGTRRQLAPAERSRRALAKLARYEADDPLPWGPRHLWRICLQDGAILSLARRDGLNLLGLLTYVLTHELVHIVRFSRFEQLFQAPPRQWGQEERLVHSLTHDVLGPLSRKPGLAPVMARYEGLGLSGCWIPESIRRL